ncbi:hypothetical protein GGR55DRAFT_672734 [Xylaria sp. FL0064]|nr:hypothetical protein GGR55DRAFT_672734 [Xylaria sp. FL0064]
MALPFARPFRLPVGFTMSRCTPADVQGMTEVYMDAFSNSEYTYWWGPIEAMRSWQEERIRRRFGDAGTQQFKVVDDANGTIVAWAKWDPPPRMVGLRTGFTVYDEAGRPASTSSLDAVCKDGEGEGEEAGGKASGKKYAQGPPPGSNTALFQDFFGGLLSMERRYQANEKLVLTHLCTWPSYHSRGIGSALLISVLDLADQEGLAVYLEATRVGVSLYQRLGFKTVDTLTFERAGTRNPPATLEYVPPSSLPSSFVESTSSRVLQLSRVAFM